MMMDRYLDVILNETIDSNYMVVLSLVTTPFPPHCLLFCYPPLHTYFIPKAGTTPSAILYNSF